MVDYLVAEFERGSIAVKHSGKSMSVFAVISHHFIGSLVLSVSDLDDSAHGFKSQDTPMPVFFCGLCVMTLRVISDWARDSIW